MRSGQQNKRPRGRSRKGGGNPMARVYESNGPDVKIRGSAMHVAEKYMTLARDASVSGDRIAAESYLQHAEHYYRIIAAAQPQNQPQANNQSYERDDQDDDADYGDSRFDSPSFSGRNSGGDSRRGGNGSNAGAGDHGAEANAAAPGGHAASGNGRDDGESAPRAESAPSPRAEGASTPRAEGTKGEDDGEDGQAAPRRRRARGRYRRKSEGEDGDSGGEGASARPQPAETESTA